MNNNLEKYKKTLAKINQDLILASNSISNESKFQNNYSIIPISNHKKGKLQLGIRNMTIGTGFIINISKTSQSVILLDKNANSYCEFISILYNEKKQTLLRCSDKSSIYEKSKLDETRYLLLCNKY